MGKEPDEFVLRSRRVVLPGSERAAAVRVHDGVIAEIAAYDAPFGEMPSEDLGDLVLLPGLVDIHVHLNEPGRTEWEGFETGTLAALNGGITTLIDMPLNSSPVTTTAEALNHKRQAAQGKLHVDVGFHGGLVPGNEDRMEELIDMGVRGIKAFLCHSGIDEFPSVTAKELRTAMPVLAKHGVPLLVHAELVHDVPSMANPRRYADYLATRPPSFERNAVAMMIDLCAETGCRVHIVHLADSGCLSMLLAARERGLPITVETCPHYLTFAAEEIEDGRTDFKCAPPIREAAHREKLWEALGAGLIDIIASDHSPCPPEMKALDAGRFDQAWGGISSLSLTLSAVWREAASRGFSLPDVVRWMSENPARLVGVPQGIAVGKPAHLVAFSSDFSFPFDQDELCCRHKLTPYHRLILHGAPSNVWVHGRTVGKAGRVL